MNHEADLDRRLAAIMAAFFPDDPGHAAPPAQPILHNDNMGRHPQPVHNIPMFQNENMEEGLHADIDDDDEQVDDVPIAALMDRYLFPRHRQPQQQRPAAVANIAESERLINELQRENVESDTLVFRFSRECSVCLTPGPRHRSVFAPCGHATCRACAEQMKLDASRARRPLLCPTCRAKSTVVPLYEHLVEETPKKAEET